MNENTTATDKELLDALAVLVTIKQQDEGAEVVLSPAEAKRLLDLARLALPTKQPTNMDGWDQDGDTRRFDANLASHLADTDRATKPSITLDDAQRRTLVAACINALPIAPGDAKLTNLISILSGTDTAVVVHRAYPPRSFNRPEKERQP